MSIPHPAKFAQAHLDAIVEILGDNPDLYVLDPFAGIGTVHQLPYRTVGVEIEPDWAKQHPDTIIGNAVNTPYDRDTFDAIVTSPCFGNRMADHHEAKDDSKRHTYRHYLGHKLANGSSAGLQWGNDYRHLHNEAWVEAKRVLKPGGTLILNIKDHIRGGEIQHVTKWHTDTCKTIGYQPANTIIIPATGLPHGTNADKRIPHETLLVFTKPTATG